MSVKFISYDGAYPNLCSGVLVVEINEQLYALATGDWQYKSRSCIKENDSIIKLVECYFCSGGCINDNFEPTTGEWSLDLDDAKTLSGVEFPIIKEYKQEITKVFNDHVEHGCCGGCI